MLLSVVASIGRNSTVFFDLALVIGVFGFVTTVALAKSPLRGEVIE